MLCRGSFTPVMLAGIPWHTKRLPFTPLLYVDCNSVMLYLFAQYLFSQ